MNLYFPVQNPKKTEREKEGLLNDSVKKITNLTFCAINNLALQIKHDPSSITHQA